MPVTLTFSREHNYGGYPGSAIVIPIHLKLGNNRPVRILAKLDTGAEYCIFKREHGEALQLDIERGIPRDFRTANGTFSTFGHAVTIECFDWEFDATVYFAADYEFERNVLGRAGWLHQFRIAIIDHDTKLHLSHYDDR